MAAAAPSSMPHGLPECNFTYVVPRNPARFRDDPPHVVYEKPLLQEWVEQKHCCPRSGQPKSVDDIVDVDAVLGGRIAAYYEELDKTAALNQSVLYFIGA